MGTTPEDRRAQDHYMRCRDGQWVYVADSDGGPVIYRKGCRMDPRIPPPRGCGDPFGSDPYGDDWGRDVALSVSEWVTIENCAVIERMLDLMNDAEQQSLKEAP